MRYDEFFERFGDHFIKTEFYESQGGIPIEEMYQHFKTRLINDLKEALAEVMEG